MKVNKIKGGGSYAEFPPNNIDNYQLDIELSNFYVKVYFSIADKKSYCYTSWPERSIGLAKKYYLWIE